MKKYIENENGSLEIDGMFIVKTTKNSKYRGALLEVETGEATIEAYAGSDREAKDQANVTAAQQKSDRKQAMLDGIEFEGVMCSATKEDMYGLKAVKDFVISGNDVPFHLENGNVINLTTTNIAAFEVVWVASRFSFFS